MKLLWVSGMFEEQCNSLKMTILSGNYKKMSLVFILIYLIYSWESKIKLVQGGA